MFQRIIQSLHTKRFGMNGLTAAAMAFFLSGLIVASEMQWTGSAGAKSPNDSTQVSMAATARPGSFANLAQELAPTVVNIKVNTMQQVRGPQWPQSPEGPFGEFFNRFFHQMPQRPKPFKQQGSGSGVIISTDGYIVTNNHVVEGAEEIIVTLSNKREYAAEIVGRDAKTDLAILRINAKKPLSVATLGDSSDLRVGDWVLAIGNPFGLSHTVTSGIVSAKGRVIGAGPYDDFIQTDASINPGNSGGPLFNLQGELVGINTAIIPHGQGIGFAIPVNTAKPLIPQLMTSGKVTRGYLGVNIQSITPELAKALELSEQQGALVSDVLPASPAAQAGIQRGDVIVTFNDTMVENSRDLAAMAAATPVDEDVTVIVLRDRQKKALSLTVGMLPSEVAKTEGSSQLAQGKWGMQLQDITPEMARRHGLAADQGVLVAAVQPGSPAAENGVRAGDMLLHVNQQLVQSVEDVKQAMAKADDQHTLLLLVKRDQGSFFVALAR